MFLGFKKKTVESVRAKALSSINTPVPSKKAEKSPYTAEMEIPRADEPVGRGVSDVNLTLYFREEAEKRLKAINKALIEMDNKRLKLAAERTVLTAMQEAQTAAEKEAVFAPSASVPGLRDDSLIYPEYLKTFPN